MYSEGMFINGEWVEAASGATDEVLNPATEEVVATVPRAAEEDVNRAVTAAREVSTVSGSSQGASGGVGKRTHT